MDIQDVKHLAVLSRLDIPEEEQQALLGDLTAIVAYIDQVTKAPVAIGDDFAPEHRNSYREDLATNVSSQANTDMLLAQAVGQQDGFVKVKKIL